MKPLHIAIFCLYFLNINKGIAQIAEQNTVQLSYDALKKEYFEVAKTEEKKKYLANCYILKGKNDKDHNRIARGYYYLSLLYYDTDPEKAIAHLNKVIEHSKKKSDKSFPLCAYREKAMLLRGLYKYDEAIENYLLAEKIAEKENPDFYYGIKLDIAELKSEELGDVEEALHTYIECFNHYKSKDTGSKDYSYCYTRTLFDLADAYISLNNPKSASYYNQLGYKNSVVTKDEEMKALFIFNEGSNLISQKKFKAGVDSIKKALPKIIALKDNSNVMASYFFLGKANEGLGNRSLAIKNYTLVDSMYQKEKVIFPELTEGYNFLINYYKATGNNELQLKYLNTLMSIDSASQKKYKNLDKIIRKKYEIPHLLANKEDNIQSLQGQNKIAFWVVIILSIISIILGLLSYYQRKINAKYKARFDKIIAEPRIIEQNNSEENTKKIITENKTESNGEDIGIIKVVVDQILEKLMQFENQRGFLNPEVSIQFLSQEFETNSRYISKIVNEFKGKGFSQYINNLRIDYAIKELQENKRLRKYSISALAAEFGFNTAESFSNAFFKQTGIKPSFFIKELEKKEAIENQ